jgi:hypothetical protein
MVLLALLLASVIHVGAAEPTGLAPEFSQSQPQMREIDGKTEPDLIPPEVAWENLFVTVTTVVGDTVDKAKDQRIEALARHNLGVSLQDARTVAAVAESTMARLAELRSVLDLEHQGVVQLNWTRVERQQRATDIQLAVLNARDRLRKDLTPQAFAALDRYVREVVIPGTKISRKVEQ